MVGWCLHGVYCWWFTTLWSLSWFLRYVSKSERCGQTKTRILIDWVGFYLFFQKCPNDIKRLISLHIIRKVLMFNKILHSGTKQLMFLSPIWTPVCCTVPILFAVRIFGQKTQESTELTSGKPKMAMENGPFEDVPGCTLQGILIPLIRHIWRWFSSSHGIC